MVAKDEILDLIDEAIRTNTRNLAHEELRKAQMGMHVTTEVENSIAYLTSEIERLNRWRDAVTNGETSAGRRFAGLSAQVSSLRAEVTAKNDDGLERLAERLLSCLDNIKIELEGLVQNVGQIDSSVRWVRGRMEKDGGLLDQLRISCPMLKEQ